MFSNSPVTNKIDIPTHFKTFLGYWQKSLKFNSVELVELVELVKLVELVRVNREVGESG